MPESTPTIVAVAPDSPAHKSGLLPGDEIRGIDGLLPRDVIEWRTLTDGSVFEVQISRGGLEMDVPVNKAEGQPLGLDVSSAVFDRVKTCDNHCPFCFIYQLPNGLRKSLYVKDDDFRLSFLYGNFTTLTRFTESDLERVVDEGLSPLNVSLHSTDPRLRASLLRNSRGSVSLRWLRALLDRGISVNGQIVVCPGLNDGIELHRSLNGILDEYPELRSIAVVPLGISRYNKEEILRAHTHEEAAQVVDIVEEWQKTFLRVLGRRLVHAADEYYIMARRSFPSLPEYDDFSMYEDGIGMARTFELEFHGRSERSERSANGFFASVDGAPATGYRAVRNPAADTSLRPVEAQPIRLSAKRIHSDDERPIAILTSEYGSHVLRPLVEGLGRSDVRIVEVRNEFFGGNIAVTGLLVGSDIARALSKESENQRFLLPDVCLSESRFLDGLSVDDLPRTVEVVPTDGQALRRALGVAP